MNNLSWTFCAFSFTALMISILMFVFFSSVSLSIPSKTFIPNYSFLLFY